MRRLFSALVVSSLLVTGLPMISVAQTNPGFTFTWGDGPTRKQQLKYVLDYGTPNVRDRYRLKLGRQDLAITRISISYPEYYHGTFDPDAIELRTGGGKGGFFSFASRAGDSLPLAEVNWDRENGLIEIKPEEIIPAGTPVEIVLKNVKNPSSGGMYYFNARVESPGDIPLMRYIGTWILSIYKS